MFSFDQKYVPIMVQNIRAILFVPTVGNEYFNQTTKANYHQISQNFKFDFLKERKYTLQWDIMYFEIYCT